ncbi:hypothetical protein BBO99_00005339 [Phytophthora kernoviae]|uniref:Uncharacterized protein n=2 Tax=Phytophthora kernoviae TaxID=325452 RepID=A0A3R7J6V7_9STRA|nr:hypothetical protein G195_009168 [Phytophthora kernoviae 00238/432]KAG2522819.1 hypothetical protein JM16_003272 [Phytophthora kernoviae]KAG2524469.1 hypothetical protein JM18_002976 [Phytophthora kernoviae]RLN79327.1 hypothetical protein BBO99_00005339 [Phytophthora kernoviae]
MALAHQWSDGREDPLGDSSSALLAASASGNEKLVISLLQQGAVEHILLSNRFFGETPCEQALEHGHLGVAELLLGAVLSHPQFREEVSELFWRRLLSAALRSHQLSVLGFVLSYEPDLNSDVRHSEKPLFDAARADEAEMLKVLLAHGADATGTDPVGSTLLHIAAKYGAMQVLDVLQTTSAREDVNAVDSLGNTALHYAADCAQLEVTRVLLKMGADVNLQNRRLTSPLHMAVSKARLDMVKLLVDEGPADVNATDYQDNTALLLLATMTISDMDEYASDSEEEEDESVHLQMAKLLLQNGADVNAANTASVSPLHHAMRRLDFDLMDVLLANGADVNQCNRFGDTPLHQAGRLALIPLEIYDTVRSFGFRGRCLTLLLAMMHFLFMLSIPILCCLRVDNLISGRWAVVLIPLWVLDAVYYGSLMFSFFFSETQKTYRFCKELLLLAAQIFIVLKLDGDIDWCLVMVLTPYFVCELLNLLETLAGGVLGHQMLVTDSIGAGVSRTEDIEEESRLLTQAVARKTIFTLLRISQGFLIGLKVDGILENTNWRLVMIPVWIHVAYFFWYPVKKYFNSTSSHRLLDVVCTTLVIVVLVFPLFLLAKRLEGNVMSSFDIVLPWMILMGVSFFFLFCAISFAGSERLIPSGVQPTARRASSPPYRGDYVAVDMD